LRIWRRSDDAVGVVGVVAVVAVVGVAVVAVEVEVEREAGGLREAGEREHEGECELSEEVGDEAGVAGEDLEVTKQEKDRDGLKDGGECGSVDRRGSGLGKVVVEGMVRIEEDKEDGTVREYALLLGLTGRGS